MVHAQCYDDRVDLDVELSFYQTLGLLGRSVFLLGQVKLLFFWKLIFSTFGTFKNRKERIITHKNFFLHFSCD